MLPSLSEHGTVDLGLQPSAVESLRSLGARLGVELVVKRDDTSVLAMGGNKVRQLEYYLGPALQAGADTVLITGAVQSNFVRLCAAAAAKLGWHAVVQLEHRVENTSQAYKHSGNVLLNHLLGAEIHYFDGGDDETAADKSLDLLSDQQRQKGRKPYVVHLGIEHAPLGGLGYVQCAIECFLQMQNNDQLPQHVVIPSGSGLTHAGFLVGARAIGWDVTVHGICVRRDAMQQRKRIARRAQEINQLLGSPATLIDCDVITDDSVLAPGYGQLNDQVLRAMRLSAGDEALLLDPVYSGRTMAGLIALTERGVIEPGASVLFVHTGGLPALFAYQEAIMVGLENSQ